QVPIEICVSPFTEDRRGLHARGKLTLQRVNGLKLFLQAWLNAKQRKGVLVARKSSRVCRKEVCGQPAWWVSGSRIAVQARGQEGLHNLNQEGEHRRSIAQRPGFQLFHESHKVRCHKQVGELWEKG